MDKGFLADGKLYRTKTEADRVDAGKDLRHLLRMTMYPGIAVGEMALRIESYSKEFEEVLVKINKNKKKK